MKSEEIPQEFRRERPSFSPYDSDGLTVWGPFMVEGSRGEISLGSDLYISEDTVYWINPSDIGRQFTFEGKPRVSKDGSISVTHKVSGEERVIRPLKESDSEYFGDGTKEMTLDELYEVATSNFAPVFPYSKSSQSESQES